jgi:hypothetical protein
MLPQIHIKVKVEVFYTTQLQPVIDAPIGCLEGAELAVQSILY